MPPNAPTPPTQSQVTKDPLLSDPTIVAMLAGLLGLVLLKIYGSRLLRVAGRLLWAFWRLTGRYWIILTFALLVVAVATLIARVKLRRAREASLQQVELILSRDDYADPHQVAAMLTAIYHQLRVRRPLFGFFVGDWTRWFLGTDHCAWEMTKGSDRVIRFRMVAPAAQMDAIMGRIQGVYENVRFGPVTPVDTTVPALQHIYQMRMVRGNHYLYTIKTMKDYQMSIVEALASAWTKEPGEVTLQFILKPLPLVAYRKLKAEQMQFQEKFLALENTDPNHPGIGYVQDKELKASMESIGHGLFTVEVRVTASSLDLIRATVGGLGEAAGANAFVETRIWAMVKQWRYWYSRRMTSLLAPFPSVMLSSAHLATLLHLPSVRLRGVPFNRITLRRAVASQRIERDAAKPVLLDEIGPVSLTEDSRKYGLRILGVQGMGKSTLMIMLILGDIRAGGKAVFVIDPKSDLARDVLAVIPPDMPFWYMDFSNPNNDVSVPLFRYAASPTVIADNIISAFQSAFGQDAIGPRSDSLLRNAVYAIHEAEGGNATLWEVYRMLSDAEYRKEITQRLRTRFQKLFWTKQNELYDKNPKFFEEICAAPRNKMERILAVPELYTAFVAGKRTVDLAAVIHQKGILVCNLAKANIGENNAAFAGSLILATIWQAIQTQSAQAVGKRTAVAVHVDEAHNVANRSTAVMLAEGRAFGLQPTFAHQFRDQIVDEEARAAFESLLQNRAVFRTESLVDAEYFAKVGARVHSSMLGVSPETQVRLTLGADDMMEMPRYHMATRFVIDGEPQPLFVGKTIDHTKHLNEEWRAENFRRSAPVHQVARPPIEMPSGVVEESPEDIDPEKAADMALSAAEVEEVAATVTGLPESPEPAAAGPQPDRPEAAPVASAPDGLAHWTALATMFGLTDQGGGQALYALSQETGKTYSDMQAALQRLSTRPGRKGKNPPDLLTALRQQLTGSADQPAPKRRRKSTDKGAAEGTASEGAEE